MRRRVRAAEAEAEAAATPAEADWAAVTVEDLVEATLAASAADSPARTVVLVECTWAAALAVLASAATSVEPAWATASDAASMAITAMPVTGLATIMVTAMAAGTARL